MFSRIGLRRAITTAVVGAVALVGAIVWEVVGEPPDWVLTVGIAFAFGAGVNLLGRREKN